MRGTEQARFAFMTGEYLRLSPFVYLYREVSALRRMGFGVETFSVRGLGDSAEAVNPEQRSEAQRTHVLLPSSIRQLLAAHVGAIYRSPRRYLEALALAWRTRPPGPRAALLQGAYFVEAGLVAAEMRRRGLSHLHNHFASSSGTVAMLAAAIGGFTFSLSEHGPDIFFNPEWWRLDEKFRRALFVCCISHFCRSQAMIFTPPERWERLHIVHCGIPPAEYEERETWQGATRLLFVGRLSAVKGLPILLQALARLRRTRQDLELFLAGDGPDRHLVEMEAARLGIAASVHVLGYQSSAQVRELLKQTDVFVLPSFAEGVPVVLMEAMASGVPVVTTRVAGIPELIEDGATGLLVPPGDAASLEHALERLLADPGLRERLGRGGRRMVEKEFDTSREAAWLGEILTKALRGEIAPIRKTGY